MPLLWAAGGAVVAAVAIGIFLKVEPGARNGDAREKSHVETLALAIVGPLVARALRIPAGAFLVPNPPFRFADGSVGVGSLQSIVAGPHPALGLTETVEVSAMVSPDKPGTSDKLMLWVSSPVTTTADEGSGPKLNLAEDSSSSEDEGAEPEDDGGAIAALVKELKGQRWDADKSVWK